MWNYTKIVMAKSMFKLAMAFNQDLPSSLVLSCRVCGTTQKNRHEHGNILNYICHALIELKLPCCKRKTWQHIIYLHGNTTLLLVLWQHIMENQKCWVAMATKKEKVWHFDKNNTANLNVYLPWQYFSSFLCAILSVANLLNIFPWSNCCKFMSWQIVLNLCHGKIYIFFHDQHSS